MNNKEMEERLIKLEEKLDQLANMTINYIEGMCEAFGCQDESHKKYSWRKVFGLKEKK